MQKKNLAQELEALERELHKPTVRGSSERTSELLHKKFREFGRGGREFSLENILKYLSEEKITWETWLGSYSLQYETADTASRRSSLWVKEGTAWKMLFHQGTPTEPFEIERF